MRCGGRDTAAVPEVESNSDIALIRELYEVWNRRDEDALVALFHEDAEIVSFAAAVEGSGSYRGHEGVREWHRNLVGTLDLKIEAREFLAYRRLVLSIPRIHVAFGETRDPATYDQGILYEVRNDRVLRSLGYKDVATALVRMGELLGGSDATG